MYLRYGEWWKFEVVSEWVGGGGGDSVVAVV